RFHRAANSHGFAAASLDGRQAMKNRRILSALFLGFAAAALSTGTALAQNWPQKPIRFIVPYPPEGGTDIVGRLLASELTKQLGQNASCSVDAAGIWRVSA